MCFTSKFAASSFRSSSSVFLVFGLLLLLQKHGCLLPSSSSRWFDEVSSSQKLRIVSTSSKVVSIDKNGSAILANLKDGDDGQIWEQSFRLGRFQDAYGGFGFALMNERSGLYLRHGIAPKEVIVTVEYDGVDSDLLWGIGPEYKIKNFHSLWATTNIFLCLSNTNGNTLDFQDCHPDRLTDQLWQLQKV